MPRVNTGFGNPLYQRVKYDSRESSPLKDKAMKFDRKFLVKFASSI
jgi:hypothetical protein